VKAGGLAVIRQYDPPKVVKRLLVLLWLFYAVVFVIDVTLYRDPLRSPLTVVLIAVTGYAIALVLWSQVNFLRGDAWADIAPYRKWIIGLPLVAEAVRLIAGVISSGLFAVAVVAGAWPLEVSIWVTLEIAVVRTWLRLRRRWRLRHADTTRRADVSEGGPTRT
jgi:hypothetical protein